MENFGSFYINRAKAIITRTNSIGLIFLFTLSYVWYKSVIPSQDVINKIVNLHEKSLYFDTVYNSLKKKDRDVIQELYIKRDTIKNRLRKQNTLQPSIIARQIFQYDTSFTKSFARKQQKFNEAVGLIKKQTDSAKKKLEDSLKTAQFEIAVPTLSSIKTDFNHGFPIWMFLAVFFLLYMSVNRNLVMFYFKKGLNIYLKDSFADDEIEHLDIQLPFWIYPIKFDNSVWRGKKINEVISDSWGMIKIIATSCLIILVLFMEFKILELVWNINNFKNVYKELLFAHSFTSQIVTFFLFAISCIVCVAWFFPYNLNFTNKPEEKTDFFEGRRNFLKYALVGGGTFFLQFSPLSFAIPKTKAFPFNYRRTRRIKNKGFKTSLSGFYINKKFKTIHYFFDTGKSLTMKTISNKYQSTFIKHLQPIDIFDYFTQLQTGAIKFPNSVYPIELEAKKFMENDLYLNAFNLLKLGIEINYFGNSANRLIFLLTKSIESNKQKISQHHRKEFLNYLKLINGIHLTNHLTNK